MQLPSTGLKRSYHAGGRTRFADARSHRGGGRHAVARARTSTRARCARSTSTTWSSARPCPSRPAAPRRRPHAAESRASRAKNCRYADGASSVREHGVLEWVCLRDTTLQRRDAVLYLSSTQMRCCRHHARRQQIRRRLHPRQPRHGRIPLTPWPLRHRMPPSPSPAIGKPPCTRRTRRRAGARGALTRATTSAVVTPRRVLALSRYAAEGLMPVAWNIPQRTCGDVCMPVPSDSHGFRVVHAGSRSCRRSGLRSAERRQLDALISNTRAPVGSSGATSKECRRSARGSGRLHRRSSRAAARRCSNQDRRTAGAPCRATAVSPLYLRDVGRRRIRAHRAHELRLIQPRSRDVRRAAARPRGFFGLASAARGAAD